MLKEPDLKPDTLTERWLRGLGWEIDQCHRREGPKEHDLFGFADQYAFSDGMHLMIQSTSHSGGNMSSRRKKIIASDYAVKWKRSCAGNLIYLVAWRDKKGAGDAEGGGDPVGRGGRPARRRDYRRPRCYP